MCDSDELNVTHLLWYVSPVRIHGHHSAHHQRHEQGGDEAQAGEGAEAPHAGDEEEWSDAEDGQGDRQVQRLGAPHPCRARGPSP